MHQIYRAWERKITFKFSLTPHNPKVVVGGPASATIEKPCNHCDYKVTTLKLNNVDIKYTQAELIDLGLSVAEGKKDYNQILAWIKEHEI